MRDVRPKAKAVPRMLLGGYRIHPRHPSSKTGAKLKVTGLELARGGDGIAISLLRLLLLGAHMDGQ